MANIIIRKYEHYNHAMGKHITSKAHYEKEMAKGGYIPFDQAQAIADKRKAELHKDYKGLSKEAIEVCKSAYDSGNRKTGELKCGDRLIEGMQKVGVRFDRVGETPNTTQGGFNE